MVRGLLLTQNNTVSRFKKSLLAVCGAVKACNYLTAHLFLCLKPTLSLAGVCFLMSSFFPSAAVGSFSALTAVVQCTVNSSWHTHRLL